MKAKIKGVEALLVTATSEEDKGYLRSEVTQLRLMESQLLAMELLLIKERQQQTGECAVQGGGCTLLATALLARAAHLLRGPILFFWCYSLYQTLRFLGLDHTKPLR